MDHSATRQRSAPDVTVSGTPAPQPRADRQRRPSRVGGARAWAVTAMLMVLMMINFADKAVLGLAATSIKAEFGLTAQQYGTISSAFFLLFSISALVVGHLADRFNTRTVSLVLALIWSAAMLPVIGPAGFTVILISRIVLGAAEGPAFGVAQHAVHKWFADADRSVPSALLTIATYLGVIVGAPALTWMIVNHGWRSAFVLVAVVGAIWSVVRLIVGRDGPADPRHRDGWRACGSDRASPLRDGPAAGSHRDQQLHHVAWLRRAVPRVSGDLRREAAPHACGTEDRRRSGRPLRVHRGDDRHVAAHSRLLPARQDLETSPGVMETLRDLSLDKHIPDTPVLWFHGIWDELIPPTKVVLPLVRKYWQAGADLRFVTIPLPEHVTNAAVGWMPAQAWISAVLRGASPGPRFKLDYPAPLPNGFPRT